MLKTHMKTGLNVRNWVGIKQGFPPFYTALISLFHLRTSRDPTGNRRGWDIPVLNVDNLSSVRNVAVSARFTRFLPDYRGS